MKALIQKSTLRLCQVADQPFPVHPNLEWIDCADDVTPETHIFDGSSFTLIPPAPPRPKSDFDILLDYVLSKPDAPIELRTRHPNRVPR